MDKVNLNLNIFVSRASKSYLPAYIKGIICWLLRCNFKFDIFLNSIFCARFTYINCQGCVNSLLIIRWSYKRNSILILIYNGVIWIRFPIILISVCSGWKLNTIALDIKIKFNAFYHSVKISIITSYIHRVPAVRTFCIIIRIKLQNLPFINNSSHRSDRIPYSFRYVNSFSWRVYRAIFIKSCLIFFSTTHIGPAFSYNQTILTWIIIFYFCFIINRLRRTGVTPRSSKCSRHSVFISRNPTLIK